MDFERVISMKKHKTKPIDPNSQVHSEFETSVGNDFNVVREETPVKKNMDTDGAAPLNQLSEDEDSVKNESSREEQEAPKMNAEEKS